MGGKAIVAVALLVVCASLWTAAATDGDAAGVEIEHDADAGSSEHALLDQTEGTLNEAPADPDAARAEAADTEPAPAAEEEAASTADEPAAVGIDEEEDLETYIEQPEEEAVEEEDAWRQDDDLGGMVEPEEIVALKEKANMGDGDACFQLGDLYLSGKTDPLRDGNLRPAIVKVDPIEAVKWYNDGAELDNADSLFQLAAIFMTGLNYSGRVVIAEDSKKAAEYMEAAADKGDTKAMTFAGVMFARGEGVEEDLVRGLGWFQKGSDAGNADSMFYLAHMTENGQGTKKDPNAASRLYTLAAQEGNEQAQERLKALSQNNAKAGDANGQYNLGVMYSQGTSVEKDLDQAFTYFWKAASQGHAASAYNIGVMKGQGQGTVKDDIEAKFWFTKAADAGYADAQFALGRTYEVGQAGVKDLSKALRYLRMAANQGHDEAATAVLRVQAAQESDAGAGNAGNPTTTTKTTKKKKNKKKNKKKKKKAAPGGNVNQDARADL